MSPTVFRFKGYQFFFFSNEEKRIHVHVSSQKGEAKFWLEPTVSLAHKYRLSDREVSKLQEIVEERQDEIKAYWQKHFTHRSR